MAAAAGCLCLRETNEASEAQKRAYLNVLINVLLAPKEAHEHIKESPFFL